MYCVIEHSNTYLIYFRFVTFYNPADIDKVLEVKEHFLDGKKIDPQRAIKSISPARSVHNIYKKLFLGMSSFPYEAY